MKKMNKLNKFMSLALTCATLFPLSLSTAYAADDKGLCSNNVLGFIGCGGLLSGATISPIGIGAFVLQIVLFCLVILLVIRAAMQVPALVKEDKKGPIWKNIGFHGLGIVLLVSLLTFSNTIISVVNPNFNTNSGAICTGKEEGSNALSVGYKDASGQCMTADGKKKIIETNTN